MKEKIIIGLSKAKPISYRTAETVQGEEMNEQQKLELQRIKFILESSNDNMRVEE